MVAWCGLAEPLVPPVVYCTAKVDAAGCTAQIDAVGAPEAAGASGFLVTASGVAPQRAGMLFFSAQPAQIPFMGAWLCVLPSVVKTAPQWSGGSSASCSGSFAFDMQALLAAGATPLVAPGAPLCAQFMYRDPGHPQGAVALSDALRFDVLP